MVKLQNVVAVILLLLKNGLKCEWADSHLQTSEDPPETTVASLHSLAFQGYQLTKPHVSGLGAEARVPRENSCKHVENMQTPDRKTPA